MSFVKGFALLALALAATQASAITFTIANNEQGYLYYFTRTQQPHYQYTCTGVGAYTQCHSGFHVQNDGWYALAPGQSASWTISNPGDFCVGAYWNGDVIARNTYNNLAYGHLVFPAWATPNLQQFSVGYTLTQQNDYWVQPFVVGGQQQQQGGGGLNYGFMTGVFQAAGVQQWHCLVPNSDGTQNQVVGL